MQSRFCVVFVHVGGGTARNESVNFVNMLTVDVLHVYGRNNVDTYIHTYIHMCIQFQQLLA